MRANKGLLLTIQRRGPLCLATPFAWCPSGYMVPGRCHHCSTSKALLPLISPLTTQSYRREHAYKLCNDPMIAYYRHHPLSHFLAHAICHHSMSCLANPFCHVFHCCQWTTSVAKPLFAFVMARPMTLCPSRIESWLRTQAQLLLGEELPSLVPVPQFYQCWHTLCKPLPTDLEWVVHMGGPLFLNKASRIDLAAMLAPH